MLRKTALFLCFGIVMLASTHAKAGIMDPRIGIGDPSCQSWNNNWGPLFNVTGTTFTFTTDGVHGFYGFCNMSSQDWTSLTLQVYNTGYIDPNQSLTSQIQCSDAVFGGCTLDLTNNLLTITFADCTGSNCGIKSFNNNNDESAAFLWVDLYDDGCDPQSSDCSNSTISWPANLTFAGGLNDTPPPPLTPPSVPEPATIILVGSGIAGAWRLRRKRN